MPPRESGLDLKARIVDEIRARGPIPVARFFEIAVADPQHGYWQRRSIIGAGGDFITAPEISQVFGELIGLWCAVTWQGMGAPETVQLIELGPGKGTLMRDILRTLRRAMPTLHANAQVHLVEVSGPFREAQARALEGFAAKPVAWHADLADVPDAPALLIANEFLDALPIAQLAREDGRWRERVVDCTEAGDLVFALGKVVETSLPGEAPEGAIAELRQGETDLIATLAARRSPLTALFIDYGPADFAFGDTLQAMRNHAYVDALEAPGTCDLTAHVQFAQVARKAQQAGLAVDGPITQAEFLGALGLATRASRLMAANPGQAAGIELAAQRLVAPTGMGTLFKAMAVRTPSTPKPPPFS